MRLRYSLTLGESHDLWGTLRQQYGILQVTLEIIYIVWMLLYYK
jgi:hypothetical protein